MDNNKDASLVQPPPSEQLSTSNTTDDEEVITQLTLAGLKVLMVRKRDQIIYKLPDNMQVAAIGEEQRQQLMKEIQALHQATILAAQNAQQKQQQAIAPKNETTAPSLDTPPQPTAAEADAIKETARKLREELEQQQMRQQMFYDSSSNPSSPHDSSKAPRRYNKTGRYSKKKQLQLQQQFNQQLPFPFQQQQHLTQQQLIALQQSLQQNNSNSTPTTPITTSAATTPISSNTPIATAFPFHQQQQQQQDTIMKISPVPTPSPALAPPSTTTAATNTATALVQTDSILSKRLPQEEFQHREVKKRFLESLLSDQKAVTIPDYETPFKSLKDAMDRLLPYHIYQYPKGDLDVNKIPLERQDHTMIEIFKCQTELFDKHATISKKIEKSGGNMSLKILIERQVLTEQRQKLTEEQARIVAEQAAQHHETLRVQAEKARLTTVAEQEARQQQIQQMLQQQLQQMQLPPQQLQQIMQQMMQQILPQQAIEQFQMQQQQQNSVVAVNNANGLAQAQALLQNPQFANQYSQLSPELQQRLQSNREQLVALIEKQRQNNINNPNNNQ